MRMLLPCSLPGSTKLKIHPNERLLLNGDQTTTMSGDIASFATEILITGFSFCRAIMVAMWRSVIPPPEKSVREEVVLVTGAGSGIGRLMAIEFARRGAVVVSWDIDDDGNAETARLVKEAGSVCHTYKVDVSDRELVEQYANRVASEVGDVSILVNNAGVLSGRKILDCPDEMIKKTFDVNLLAHFWTTKALLPSMINKNHGHVVTVASLAGLFGTNKLSDYSATKFGTVGLTEAFDIEMVASGHDINVTTICPFFINTGLFYGCTNRFPWLLPTLDPQKTVERIMKAILTNQKVLYVPRMMYFLAVLKTILPVDAFLIVHKFLGATNFMDTFIGRRKEN